MGRVHFTFIFVGCFEKHYDVAGKLNIKVRTQNKLPTYFFPVKIEFKTK